MYEYRCDERLKAEAEGSTRLAYVHWVAWGTGTPKDRDEVNRREVCECDGECVI
jgi:5-methylcytosine-specific restriction endonuclease McrA